MSRGEAAVEVHALKERHRAVWNAGEYAVIAQLVTEVAERCALAAAPTAGEGLLDVATGTGNVAIVAARMGAVVTGLDLASSLVDVARARAREAGVQADFIVGDAEHLPFPDASFDHVTSCIGIQFAPRHGVVAAEMSRVLRPGGRVTLCNWTRDGYVGRLFDLIAEYSPPAPEFASPPGLWGDEAHVRSLLEPHGVELGFERAECVMPFDFVEDYLQVFERQFGPTVVLKAALEPQSLYGGFRERWTDLVREFCRTPARGDVVKEYLVIRGVKAG